jgi:hypothetical protein
MSQSKPNEVGDDASLRGSTKPVRQREAGSRATAVPVGGVDGGAGALLHEIAEALAGATKAESGYEQDHR